MVVQLQNFTSGQIKKLYFCRKHLRNCEGVFFAANIIIFRLPDLKVGGTIKVHKKTLGWNIYYGKNAV